MNTKMKEHEYIVTQQNIQLCIHFSTMVYLFCSHLHKAPLRKHIEADDKRQVLIY